MNRSPLTMLPPSLMVQSLLSNKLTNVSIQISPSHFRQSRSPQIQQIIVRQFTKCSEIPMIRNMYSSSCPSSEDLLTRASIRLGKPRNVSGNYLRYLMFSPLALFSSDLVLRAYNSCIRIMLLIGIVDINN
jgi:hypothetical protein